MPHTSESGPISVTRLWRRLSIHQFWCLLGHPCLVVSCITLLGMLLRVYHLGQKSLWLDEAKLFWIAHGSVDATLMHNAADNSAPPLYAILLNAMERVNESEVALRAISCIAGTVSIPLVYLFARKYASRGGAYLSAFLVATSLTQVKYSQQLREYSLAFLLAVAMYLIFCEIMKAPRWGRWAVFAVVWSVGIATQYGLALLGAVLLFMLIIAHRAEKITLLRGLAPQVIVPVTVAIVYEFSLKYQLISGGFASGSTSDYLASGYWNGSLQSLIQLSMINTGLLFSFTYYTSIFLFPLFFGLFCIGLGVSLRRSASLSAVLLFGVPVAVVFATACLKLYPYSGSRQDVFLTPMIYVFAGIGGAFIWSAHPWRWFTPAAVRVAVLALLVVLIVGGLQPTLRYLQSNDVEDMKGLDVEDMKGLVHALTPSLRSGDTIYTYYAADAAFSYYYRGDDMRRVVSVYSRKQPEQYLRQLDDVLPNTGRVWMVFSHCYANECEMITQYASQQQHVELVVATPGAWLYLKTPNTLAHDR